MSRSHFNMSSSESEDSVQMKETSESNEKPMPALEEDSDTTNDEEEEPKKEEEKPPEENPKQSKCCILI